MRGAQLFGLLLLGLATLCAAVAYTPAGLAAGGAHPILLGAPPYKSYSLVGGVVDGRWVKDEAIAPRVRAGMLYRVFSPIGPLGQARSVGAPKQTEAASLEVELRGRVRASKLAVGIAGRWNPLPRIPRRLSTDIPAYRAAVGAVLRVHGLPAAPVRVTGALRVDLDGDGEPEVVLSASSMRDPPDTHARAGGYSFVVLRRVVGGRVRTDLLAGDFYTKSKRLEEVTPNVYNAAAALDLDGDGKMEILVHSRYYEGEGLDVFQLTRAGVRRVLTWGAGA